MTSKVRIPRNVHVAIAKCIRNAELEPEQRARLMRDLCVFFKENNPVGFDQKRFNNICIGMNIKDSAFKNMSEFDTIKYLDEVWNELKK